MRYPLSIFPDLTECKLGGRGRVSRRRKPPGEFGIADKEGFHLRVPTQASKGFTLIEVLTSIVIIAVLATLLLGALRMVLKAGYNAGCLQNLRSIHTAAMAYGADNDGRLPDAGYWWNTSMWGDGGPLPNAASYSLLPYLGLSHTVSSQSSASANKPRPKKSVLSCPAIQASPYPSTWTFGCGYGLNIYMWGSHYQKSNSPKPSITNTYARVRKMAKFDFPSQTMFFSCAALGDMFLESPFRGMYNTLSTQSFIGELPDPMVRSVNRFTYPHGGESDGYINAIFLDGHVERVHKQHMISNLTNPLSEPEASLFWFGNRDGVQP